MPTINQLLNRCAISLCALAALVLSACGPGTGGTGTGPTAGTAPVTFTSAAVTAIPSLPGVSCTAACPSNLDSQAMRLHLQTDRIELTTPCATFTYAGDWSVSATGEVTVPGVWEISEVVNGQIIRSSQIASLTLGFPNGLDSSSAVNVSMQDSTGQLLLGPITLQRAADAQVSVSASGC
jgi:hypothetical protein